ncbi:MAG: metal ABC transporter permease [Planctomycetota bacterium]
MTLDLGLDLFPLTAAVLAALTCGLLGNFLVLRRQSLMGDAISHAVLPGLVIAFLVTASRSPLLMFAGATLAGVATVVLIEAVKRLGRVEPGAAMGVVFSVMFALGVLLIEQAAARHIDLDADCVLYGQLETLAWFEAPATLAGLWSWSTVLAVPRQVWLLAIVGLVSLAFVGLFFKELRIAAFDPGLASAQGIHAGVMHYALMILVAAATVAAFEAVGSILVIAMLIAPAAAARLLTDRLGSQLAVSLIAAAAAAVLGYLAATALPAALDAPSVNAAGSMTVLAGALVVGAAVLSPSHGLLVRALRRRRLGRTTAVDDLLATLYRADETGLRALAPDRLRDALVGRPLAAAIGAATREGLVRRVGHDVALTDDGRHVAARLIRNHRLWETYLVDQAGVTPDHAHDPAEQLEHLDVRPDPGPTTDPHGQPIPDVNGDPPPQHTSPDHQV